MSNVRDLKQPEDQRLAGVTFTYADCNNRLLHGALEKLDNYTGFSGADLSRFNKIKNAFEIKSKEVSRLFKKLVDKHAHQEAVTTTDEETGETKPVLKGNGKPLYRPKMLPMGRGRMDFDFKDRAAFNVDYKELMSEEFKVEAYRLLTEDLRKAGLTPKEIRACAKILSDVDPEIAQASPIFDDDEGEDDDDSEADAETAVEAPNRVAGASASPEVSSDPSRPADVPTGH